ncbi:MAG: hypothetical protein ACN6RH_15675 [Stenotrophomonas rhizophila]|uniref:hypothetical protein n=1 Tax=Stenotrophomonas rhizophila TaxID=216778 RepID=UPI003D14A773
MSEIIQFLQRMRFTALRTFDAQRGCGGVVAVFFTPEGGRPIHGSPPPTNESVALRLVAADAAPPTGRQKARCCRDAATQ